MLREIADRVLVEVERDVAAVEEFEQAGGVDVEVIELLLVVGPARARDQRERVREVVLDLAERSERLARLPVVRVEVHEVESGEVEQVVAIDVVVEIVETADPAEPVRTARCTKFLRERLGFGTERGVDQRRRARFRVLLLETLEPSETP